MLIVSPLPLRTQLAVVFVVLLGLTIILRLLYKRKMSEGLCLLWLTVLACISAVALSERSQLLLAEIVGVDAAMSTVLIVSWGGVVSASLVYSVLISRMHASINDITSYAARLRLDLDEIQEMILGIITQDAMRDRQTRAAANGRLNLDAEEPQGNHGTLNGDSVEAPKSNQELLRLPLDVGITGSTRQKARIEARR